MNITSEQLDELLEQYNRRVKDVYECTDKDAFFNWIAMEANEAEQYIEISSHLTRSGHAEIIDLD
mgnify:CR=1 FL=1